MRNPFTVPYCEVTALDSLLVVAAVCGICLTLAFIFAVYDIYFKK